MNPRLIILSLAAALPAMAAGKPLLWYQQPAGKWTEALPIGNGHMGAMVFGGVAKEQLQFNESTVWTGKPHAYHHEGAVEFLARVANSSRSCADYATKAAASPFKQTNSARPANTKRQNRNTTKPGPNKKRRKPSD